MTISDVGASLAIKSSIFSEISKTIMIIDSKTIDNTNVDMNLRMIYQSSFFNFRKRHTEAIDDTQILTLLLNLLFTIFKLDYRTDTY